MKLKEIKPVGSQIVVSLLEINESLGTSLLMPSNVKSAPPHGIVLAFGPKLDKDCGLSVGDRVLLDGTYKLLPQFGDSKTKALIEFHNIRGIVVVEE